MKYLFYDTECSNCFGNNGKLCEFGYVITNEKFEVLEKKGIIMSPGTENKFDKTIYKRDPDFDWAFNYEYYFEKPEFPVFYKKIKELLIDKETMVFGYAVENDIRYLFNTCDRYNLSCFDFCAYDIQTICRDVLTNYHAKYHLTEVFQYLYGTLEFDKMQSHYSRDDAIMTMRIIEKICKLNNCSLEKLLEKTPDSKYDALDYYKHYKANKEFKMNRKINGEIWKKLVNKNTNEGDKYDITGLIKQDNDIFNKICEFVNSHNIAISNKIDDSKYLVCLDESDVEKMKEVLKTPFEGTYITARQLFEER